MKAFWDFLTWALCFGMFMGCCVFHDKYRNERYTVEAVEDARKEIRFKELELENKKLSFEIMKFKENK